MFLDVEREHAFAKMRFGDAYPHIEQHDLDGARMEFRGPEPLDSRRGGV